MMRGFYDQRENSWHHRRIDLCWRKYMESQQEALTKPGPHIKIYKTTMHIIATEGVHVFAVVESRYCVHTCYKNYGEKCF